MTWNRDDGLCMNTQKEHRVKCDQYIDGTQDVYMNGNVKACAKKRTGFLLSSETGLLVRDAGANFQQEAKVFVGKGCLCAVQVLQVWRFHQKLEIRTCVRGQASASGPAKW